MERREFLRQLDEVFELAPGTITVEQRLQDVPGWDSLTFLGLIAMADERYGVTLIPRDVLNCRTVEELVALVLPSGQNQIAA